MKVTIVILLLVACCCAFPVVKLSSSKPPTETLAPGASSSPSVSVNFTTFVTPQPRVIKLGLQHYIGLSLGSALLLGTLVCIGKGMASRYNENRNKYRDVETATQTIEATDRVGIYLDDDVICVCYRNQTETLPLRLIYNESSDCFLWNTERLPANTTVVCEILQQLGEEPKKAKKKMEKWWGTKAKRSPFCFDEADGRIFLSETKTTTFEEAFETIVDEALKRLDTKVLNCCCNGTTKEACVVSIEGCLKNYMRNTVQSIRHILGKKFAKVEVVSHADTAFAYFQQSGELDKSTVVVSCGSWRVFAESVDDIASVCWELRPLRRATYKLWRHHAKTDVTRFLPDVPELERIVCGHLLLKQKDYNFLEYGVVTASEINSALMGFKKSVRKKFKNLSKNKNSKIVLCGTHALVVERLCNLQTHYRVPSVEIMAVVASQYELQVQDALHMQEIE